GAAGGMGAALYAFCGAQLRRGIEIVTDALHLEACLADADLVIKGVPMGDEKSLAHTRWNCKYHIVFAPKYRRQAFYGEKRRAVG
ncbi:glycerate kinase, partial [Salmonella enterica subsp. enterica serovar Cerro]|nr:glycerate kinase [Salmonella enterica subsp. enterica serovar Cerro]